MTASKPGQTPTYIHLKGDSPHFLPWVGANFGGSGLGAKRLLILGEAHYSNHPEDDQPSLTRDLIADIKSAKRHIAFFTKLQSLLGESSGETASIWDAIAFYNYIPGLAGTAARVRPTPAMWAAAAAPFTTVINDVRPDRVLMTGVDLWNSVSAHFPQGWSSVEFGPKAYPEYTWSGPTHGPVRATWINHPSSPGFSSSAWLDRIGSLLA